MRLVLEAGRLAEPGGTLRADAAILVEDGRIAAIEPRAALADVAADARLGGPDCLALPGLVNAHQHGRPNSTVALGAPDAPLECWLVSLLALPEVDPYADTVRLCRRLVAAGVTTAVHSHYTTATTPEAFEAELRALLAGYRDGGVRGVVAADLRDRGQPVYGGDDDFLSRLPGDLADRFAAVTSSSVPLEAALEVVRGLRTEALGDVELILGPPGPPWCSDELLERVARASADDEVRVHTHLHETLHERALGVREHGAKGTVGALARLGLLSERLFVAHGVWLDDSERAALAAAGVSVVTNPSSNLRLHAGVAPVRELLAAGVNVALGSDNMALGESEELLDELRLLRALHRRPGIDEDGLPPRTLLRMVTEAGGQALGRDDVGVLRPGVRGDVLLVDLGRLERPGAAVAPLELALATARPADLLAVVAGGRVVAERGVASLPNPSVSLASASPERAELAQALLPHVREHFRAWDTRPTEAP